MLVHSSDAVLWKYVDDMVGKGLPASVLLQFLLCGAIVGANGLAAFNSAVIAHHFLAIWASGWNCWQ